MKQKRKNAFLAQGGPDAPAHLKCFCALRARLVAAADAAHAAHAAATVDAANSSDAARALEVCRAALAKATTDAQRSQKDVKRARDAARHLAGELKSLTRDASEKEAENKLLEEGLSEAIAAARTMKNELREEQARSAAWAQRCGADAAARERGQAEALHVQKKAMEEAPPRRRKLKDEAATALGDGGGARDARRGGGGRARFIKAAFAAERALADARSQKQ